MKKFSTIEEYIKSADPSVRSLLKEFRQMTLALVKNGEEVIRYGMPTIQVDGHNLFHYAAMKGHFGFYPTPSAIHAFSSDLVEMGIDFSKGCVRFPYEKKLPLALIKKMIRFRLKELA